MSTLPPTIISAKAGMASRPTSKTRYFFMLVLLGTDPLDAAAGPFRFAFRPAISAARRLHQHLDVGIAHQLHEVVAGGGLAGLVRHHDDLGVARQASLGEDVVDLRGRP